MVYTSMRPRRPQASTVDGIDNWPSFPNEKAPAEAEASNREVALTPARDVRPLLDGVGKFRMSGVRSPKDFGAESPELVGHRQAGRATFDVSRLSQQLQDLPLLGIDPFGIEHLLVDYLILQIGNQT